MLASTCLSSIWRIKCQILSFYHTRRQNYSIITYYIQLFYRKHSHTHTHTIKYQFYAYPNVRFVCNMDSLMHFTMPRIPYHYNDTAVKLPGYIVAMVTLCAAESLIVVLCYRYLLACTSLIQNSDFNTLQDYFTHAGQVLANYFTINIL